jgi:hypothetical protein
MCHLADASEHAHKIGCLSLRPPSYGAGTGVDVTTHKVTPDRQARKRRGEAGRGGCPPHGPIMVAASEEGRYAASCLACGLRGPEREDGWEAKLAFDEAIQPTLG